MSKYLMLDAATATGAGSEVGFSKNPETLNFQVVDTGGATQITIAIETSNDGGTTYDTLLTHDVTADGDTFQFSGNPGETIQANLTVLTAGTSPTVTLRAVE